MAGGNLINTYQGQADSNSTSILPGVTTIYTYNFGGLVNNHKVATIEASAVVFDLQNYATSSGWIHYVAPLNTSVAFGGSSFNAANLKPNLPGTEVPGGSPPDDGVLSVNVGGIGPNFAYIHNFYFDPQFSTLYLKAENSISGSPQPISWRINWKITCF
jgi:hypothetical protein